MAIDSAEKSEGFRKEKKKIMKSKEVEDSPNTTIFSQIFYLYRWFTNIELVCVCIFYEIPYMASAKYLWCIDYWN